MLWPLQALWQVLGMLWQVVTAPLIAHRFQQRPLSDKLAVQPPELVEFDDAALDIIHRIDANMFEEWGYKKRTAFNLRVQTGAPH